MVIYFGSDHRGFRLKEVLVGYVKNQGFEVFDLGNARYDEEDDYPDFAAAVARKISVDPDRSRGVLICGSGVGVDISANKFRNVRSAVAISPDQIYAVRHEDDVNILCLASDYVSEEDAKKIVEVFLATKFGSEERYGRRINKISLLENEND